VRYHEQTPSSPTKASGVLSGLTRVRSSHRTTRTVSSRRIQIGEEVERLIRLVQRVYKDFGLPFTAKAVDQARGIPRRDLATWDHAEGQLKEALAPARGWNTR
jgi:threonyl-tRNA synthetase